jgi:hypothetical protein
MMRRYQMYRGWCPDCQSYLSWREPTCRAVDKLLCPGCGRLVDAFRGSSMDLKGEMSCEARTFVEPKTGRTRR